MNALFSMLIGYLNPISQFLVHPGITVPHELTLAKKGEQMSDIGLNIPFPLPNLVVVSFGLLLLVPMRDDQANIDLLALPELVEVILVGFYLVQD